MTVPLTLGSDLPSTQEAAATLQTLRRRGRVFLWVAGLTCVPAVLWALSAGAMDLSLDAVVRALLGDATVDATTYAVIWSIRVPRVIMGLLVGASLGLAGAVLQGLFRNPLADPGLIGVASGARLGAAICIVAAGSPWLQFLGEHQLWAIPLFAFAGALGATTLVVKIASRRGATATATLLLAGVAVTFFAEAVVGWLTTIADDKQLRELTLWRLGSLGGATWDVVTITASLSTAAGLLLLRYARALDLFLLGETEANHLGLDAGRLKRQMMWLSALIVASAVAFAGVISFIGLAVPHIVRMVTGPSHRFVLPGSMLVGAALAVGADTISRLVIAPAELPISVVTAAVGAPFFVGLLLRSQRRGTL